LKRKFGTKLSKKTNNFLQRGTRRLTSKKGFLFDILIVLICLILFGIALNIIWDFKPLHVIFGNTSANREFSTSVPFSSAQDNFTAYIQFTFDTDQAFCAYNPIHVRAVLLGNRLNQSDVQGISLFGSRFILDNLDVYGVIPQTGFITLHAPVDPKLIVLSQENPGGLILEGETTLQWNLEGDYGWAILTRLHDVNTPSSAYGASVIHISSVDIMTQIRGNQRIEALTYALFGLSVLTAQPIVKAISKELMYAFKKKRSD
jgi:hypothetical protein